MSRQLSQRGHRQPAVPTSSAVQWSDQTFHLPSIPPSTAKPHEKATYFATTVNAFDTSSADAMIKINAFSSRFPAGKTLTREIEGYFTNLLDVNDTGGWDTSPRITHPNTFTCANVILKNANGGNLNLPAAGVAIPPATRAAARYTAFDLTVSPTAGFTGDLAYTHDLQPRVWISLGVRLPTVAGNLDPAVTADQLNDPQALCAGVAAIEGLYPVIGYVRRGAANNAPAEFDTELFKTEFMTFFHQCRFKVLKPMMKRDYLGAVAAAGTDVAFRLAQCHQHTWQAGARVHRTIEEYYNEFSVICATNPRGGPFPLDVAQTFFNGVGLELQQQANAQGMVIPPPPDGETQSDALNRLRMVKEDLIAIETSYNVTQAQINRSRNSGRANTRAFAALPLGDTLAHINAAVPGQWGEETYAPYGADPSYGLTPDTYVCATCTEDTDTCDPNTLFVAGMCMMSVCEDAMQKATGTRRPPPECWGCKNHPSYHGERFHLFRDCPNKRDPQVQANAKQGLDEFLASRRQGRYGRPSSASMATSDWKNLGYPSEEKAKLLCAATDPSTTVVARQALCRSIFKAEVRFAGPDEPDPRAQRKRSAETEESPRKTGKPKSQFLCLHSIPVLQVSKRTQEAISKHFDAELGVTQSLPHLNLPIGVNKEGLLNAMVDTGAGLNLGKLGYHASIAKQCPAVVHQFAYFKDVGNLDDFDIGGVSRETAMSVTAAITYKTPYRVKGQSILVTFALSENASANTIIGLPCLRGTESAVFLSSTGEDTLLMQLLGATFKIDFHPPLLAESSPRFDSNSQAAFVSNPASDPSLQAAYQSIPAHQSVLDSVESLRRDLAATLSFASSSTIPDERPAQGVAATMPRRRQEDAFGRQE